MSMKRVFTRGHLLMTGIVAMFMCSANTAHAVVYSLSIGDDIQTAINLASNGDTIELAAGTYTVTNQLEILNKGITLKGTSGALNTVIQRDVGSLTDHRILYIDGSASATGGVYDSSVGTTVLGLTFRNGVAPAGNSLGGNIYVKESPYTIISNSIIENGTAVYGGGIDMEVGGTLLNSIVRFNNTPNGSLNQGGGVYLRYGGNTVENSIIYGNFADVGGGVAIQNSGIDNDPALGGLDSRSRILNSTIADNTADGYFGIYGGGVGSQLQGKTAFITDTIVWDNLNNNIDNIAPGGGTLIVSNTDTNNPGGSYIGSNNISTDPQFIGSISAPWEYYKLNGASPAQFASTTGGPVGAILFESDFMGAAASTPPVPEPATASLLGVSALMLAFRRRRRRCA